MGHKPKIYSDWDVGINCEFDAPVDIYVDVGCYEYSNANDGTLKILFLCEPPDIHPDLYLYTIANYDKYDYILTYYDKILEFCNNAVFYRHYVTWISNDYDRFDNKKFGVSTVVGYKQQTRGHWLRHRLWELQHNITNIPVNFYASQHGGYPRLSGPDVFQLFREGRILGDSKLPLFDYQFHVVIENVSMPNMFSEKLIDAFMTKTIPIYWGCTNISEIYDPAGMFICNNIDDIIEACNCLTEHTYESLLSHVEKNYEKSLEICGGTNNLESVIVKLCNEKKNK